MIGAGLARVTPRSRDKLQRHRLRGSVNLVAMARDVVALFVFPSQDPYLIPSAGLY